MTSSPGVQGPLHVFLTGCASGIGRHLADVFLDRGHRVVATDVNEQALRSHAQARKWPQDRVLLERLDVRDSQDWDRVFQEAVRRWEHVDVLINVAGYLKPGWAHEMPAEEVHRHIDINTKGVIFGTQRAARQMIKQGKGHIINIASMAALAPIPGLSLYSASKYAVRSFSLAVAQELRGHGVFVTSVSPDIVQTPMLDLQKNKEEAALAFSGSGVLTVEDISNLLFERVLESKPLEVHFPAHRGWLARFADVFPGTQALLVPRLRKKGLARQKVTSPL